MCIITASALMRSCRFVWGYLLANQHLEVYNVVKTGGVDMDKDIIYIGKNPVMTSGTIKVSEAHPSLKKFLEQNNSYLQKDPVRQRSE